MRALAIALALLVLAGPAAAASVRGHLDLDEGARLVGGLRLASDEAALDLEPALLAGEAVGLTFGRAEGTLFTSVREYHADSAYIREESSSSPVAWPRGSLAGLSCAAPCKAFLFTERGELAIAGASTGGLVALGAPREYWTGYADAQDADFYREVPAEAWNVTGRAGLGPATILDGAVAEGAGRLGLLLWGVTGDLVAGARSEEVWTGTKRTPMEGPAGIVLGTRSERRALVLTLEDARFETSPGTAAAFMARRAHVALDGSFSAPLAEGALVVDGRRIAVDREPVRIDGALGLSPAARPGLLPAAGATGALASDVEGEASLVQVGSAALVRSPPPGVAVGVTAAALLIPLLVLLVKSGLVAALYTRLYRATLLANANRRAVYDAIREAPGAHVLEIARRTGLAEGVVRHHLKMLLDHEFVQEREAGRLRAYFALDGSPVDPNVLLSLKDDTRRRLALTVARSAEPLSQQEVAARAACSQRLASYHLARLRDAGLVAYEGSMPRRYRPTERLAEFARDATPDPDVLRS